MWGCELLSVIFTAFHAVVTVLSANHLVCSLLPGMLECLLYTIHLEGLPSEHLQGECHKHQQTEIVTREIASKLISLPYQKKPSSLGEMLEITHQGRF